MTLNFNIGEIDFVAQKVLKSLQSKTVLLYGEMGVGKTTFISALVNALGSKSEVSSPTFSLVNEYKVTNDTVYHFDFYRIENEEEALDIGVEDYFYSNNWVFIEWPDKINGLLPNTVEIIELKMLDNEIRSLKMRALRQ